MSHRRGPLPCWRTIGQEDSDGVYTFIVYAGLHPDIDSAEADYDLVKDLHRQAGFVDAV